MPPDLHLVEAAVSYNDGATVRVFALLLRAHVARGVYRNSSRI